MRLEDKVNEYISQSLAAYKEDGIYFFLKNVDLEYIMCSENLLQLTNASKADFLGKTDHDFTWGEPLADLFRADDIYIIENKKKHISEYNLNINQNKVWIKTVKTPILEASSGEVIGIFGVAYDISESKKIRIISSSNLKAANHASIRLNTSFFKCFHYYASILISEIERLRHVNYSHEVLGKNILKNQQITVFIMIISEIMLKLSNRSELNSKVRLNSKIKESIYPYISSGLIECNLNSDNETDYIKYIVIIMCLFDLITRYNGLEKIVITNQNKTVPIEVKLTTPSNNSYHIINLHSLSNHQGAFIELILEVSDVYDITVKLVLDDGMIQGFLIDI
jgi:hypothetical protein